jgi:hypothetical protein
MSSAWPAPMISATGRSKGWRLRGQGGGATWSWSKAAPAAIAWPFLLRVGAGLAPLVPPERRAPSAARCGAWGSRKETLTPTSATTKVA